MGNKDLDKKHAILERFFLSLSKFNPSMIKRVLQQKQQSVCSK